MYKEKEPTLAITLKLKEFKSQKLVAVEWNSKDYNTNPNKSRF